MLPQPTAMPLQGRLFTNSCSQNGVWRWVLAMIDDLGIARAVHLLAIVYWIGGMAVVATIVLPHARSFPDADAALGAFEAFERRFAQQVRISILLTGMSGFT